MESGKRSIGRSLKFRLILIFSCLGFIAAVGASLWSYYAVKNETLNFIDEELSQIAATVINYNMLIPKRWEGPRQAHRRMFFRRHHLGEDTQIVIEEQNSVPGRMRMRQPREVPSLGDLSTRRFDIVIAPLYGQARNNIFLPAGIADGFYTVLISDNRTRVFVATKPDGERFVVARPLDVVNDISAKALNTSFYEFLGLLVIYIPIVIVSVNLTFKAVKALALKLDKRKENDLSPIVSEHKGYIPSELDSFIGAIDRLFDKVEESMAVQQRFIADAAHEMRTPLAALSLQAESLAGEDLPPKAKEKLQDLRQSIEREKDLMNALLSLTRLQNNREQAVFAPCPIEDLFIALIEELSPLAEKKDIDFGVDGPMNFTAATSKPDLKCVLNNFIVNAIKYTPHGGRVDLTCKEEGAFLVLAVKDTGPGIADEYLERVFTPFFRVDGDSAKVPGTGLGLAIAKAAAKRAGADVRLFNQREGGLCAQVRVKKAVDGTV